MIKKQNSRNKHLRQLVILFASFDDQQKHLCPAMPIMYYLQHSGEKITTAKHAEFIFQIQKPHSSEFWGNSR